MIADPVTTITLTAGTPQSVKFASSYPFYWIDNKTSGNVYARIGGTPAPDSDGTFTIAAGSQLRVSGGAFDNDITLLGSGKVQIIASELASCPFKLGSKGGGNEISGESSYSVDAVDYPLLGLNLFGRSVQDGTPTPDAPVNIVSVGDNGFDIISKDDTHFNLLSVRDSGGDIITKQPVSTVAKVGKQTTFTVVATGDGLTYQWQWSADGGKTWKNTSTTTASYTVTPSASFNGYKYRCVITYSNGKSVISDEATLYVLADDCEVKTASIATDALPLCGIPVESGGNYTDNNGQQWLCDTLVYNADGTGKIIKRTGKIDSYNSETVSGEYISSTGGLDIGATVIYQLASPHEIELTSAEVDALRTLQTFDGVTSISNSAGAEMSVKYCTNKALSEYVLPITNGLQMQIDELRAAVLSLGGNV